MGKRNRPNRINQKRPREDSDNDDDNMNVQNQEQISDMQQVLNQLQSKNMSERESIVLFLSSYQFRPEDSKAYTAVPFLTALVSLLNDPYLKIRNHTISSLTNLVTTFSENSIEKDIINNTNFVTNSFKFFNEFISFDTTNNDYINAIRGIKNLLDFYTLITDLYEEDLKIDFPQLIKILINIAFTRKDKNDDEIFILTNKLISNILSVAIISIDSDEVKKYIDEMNNYLKSDMPQKNQLLCTIYSYNIFFFVCLNYSTMENKVGEILPKCIDEMYKKISNVEIFKMLDSLNAKVKNFSTKETNEMNDIDNQETADLKLMLKEIDRHAQSILLSLECFDEIVNGISSQKKDQNSTQSVEDDEFEEVDENEEEDTPYEKIITSSIVSITSSNNHLLANRIITNDFLVSLSGLTNFHSKISQFYLNENDKTLTIQETILDIEYISLSMINNIIYGFSTVTNEDFVKQLVSFIMTKIQNIGKKSNDLSLYLMTLRNLITKFPKIPITEKDIERLISTIGDNEDIFVKCNIIDIICSYCSTNGKFMIGQKLKDMLTKENNVEVISHVANGIMDVFKEDDLESNKYLKGINLVEMMKSGLSFFKKMIADSKKELDKETRDDLKLCLKNMRAFVSYKENSFKELNI